MRKRYRNVFEECPEYRPGHLRVGKLGIQAVRKQKTGSLFRKGGIPEIETE